MIQVMELITTRKGNNMGLDSLAETVDQVRAAVNDARAGNRIGAIDVSDGNIMIPGNGAVGTIVEPQLFLQYLQQERAADRGQQASDLAGVETQAMFLAAERREQAQAQPKLVNSDEMGIPAPPGPTQPKLVNSADMDGPATTQPKLVNSADMGIPAPAEPAQPKLVNSADMGIPEGLASQIANAVQGYHQAMADMNSPQNQARTAERSAPPQQNQGAGRGR
jgi:hypothetical protein